MLAGFTAVTTFAALFAAVPRSTATLVEPAVGPGRQPVGSVVDQVGPAREGTSLVSVCEGSVREPSALKIVRPTMSSHIPSQWPMCRSGRRAARDLCCRRHKDRSPCSRFPNWPRWRRPCGNAAESSNGRRRRSRHTPPTRRPRGFEVNTSRQRHRPPRPWRLQLRRDVGT